MKIETKKRKFKIRKETVWKIIVVISSVLLILSALSPLLFMR